MPTRTERLVVGQKDGFEYLPEAAADIPSLPRTAAWLEVLATGHEVPHRQVEREHRVLPLGRHAELGAE